MLANENGKQNRYNRMPDGILSLRYCKSTLFGVKMKIVNTIYHKLKLLENITQDEFSIKYLKQSKSYYSSLCSRNLDVSNESLINLMNALSEKHKNLILSKNENLKSVGWKYHSLLKEVANEIAIRNTKASLANLEVRRLVLQAITSLNEENDPSAPPIIIC